MTRVLALVPAVLMAAGFVLVSSGAPAPAAQPTPRVVLIYAPRGIAGDCAHVLPLRRLVPAPGLLTGAMRALLAGPTKAERARGYGGWFSAKTAGHLRSVRVTRGVAYVDFRTFAAHIPSASASCGSTLLLAQLDRTARQFPTVHRAIYSFDGSRRAFYEWLQREPPEG